MEVGKQWVNKWNTVVENLKTSLKHNNASTWINLKIQCYKREKNEFQKH